MEAHVHNSPVQFVVLLLAIWAAFATLHLFALSRDTRFGRVIIGSGF